MLQNGSLDFSAVFQNFGLEYERYLKEVVNVLETDPEFKRKLEESNVTDIKVGCFYFIWLNM